VAENLMNLQRQAPGILRHPQSIYLVTQLTAAESSAARVPAMEKELSQMKARVKELETLTAPGAPGQPPRLNGQIPFEQQSREEQFAALEAMANGVRLR
jgi:hypothetical protein